ncbi:TetR/AcrR family transcriptional regulator [Paenibacillus thailandensis]|uniref:TetR/AcrR family transcriptional regulator n=1 Tax=Paenibacillus thailandensis TaxID=393250 RepID=A0ABW5QWG0_9BACL
MREKTNSRDTIVETAAELFAKQGYHGTGLNQIIKESRCPKGSLYYYFPEGKEELAVECMHRIRREVADKWEELFAKAEQPADAIESFIEGMAKEAEASGFDCFIPFSFWMAPEASSVSGKLRQACQQVLDSWQRIVSGHLQASGVARSKADEIAMVVISLTEGALLLAQTNRDSQPIRNAAKYVRLLFNNINNFD